MVANAARVHSFAAGHLPGVQREFAAGAITVSIILDSEGELTDETV